MSGNLCEHCTAVCCRYVALPIETPTERSEFDDIRWYLIHEGISVFVEDGDWYICFQTPCRHLLEDHRCGIYATRPRICRAYSSDNCDYHSGDYGWEQHFTAVEHLDAYLREHLDEKGRVRQPPRGKRGKHIHGHLRGKLPRGRRPVRHRQPPPAQVDRAGVPLPILPLLRDA